MDKQEINAGYAIKERFVVGNVGIALGHSETAVAPYVTWNYRKEAPKHFFWGHYFSSEREAMQDYENRINEEVRHFEEKTGKPFPIPRLCLSVMPSTGDLINIKRGVHGYYPSDWNKTEGKEHNREIADFANEKLGVTKAQAAAMLHGSMFGWQIPAANPKSYDDNGKMKHIAKDEPER